MESDCEELEIIGHMNHLKLMIMCLQEIQKGNIHDLKGRCNNFESDSANFEEQICRIAKNINNIIDLLKRLHHSVIDKQLMKWRRDQALAVNGAAYSFNTLENIQSWFEQLADAIVITRSVCDEMRKGHNFQIETLDVQSNELRSLWEQLITSAIIVEKQPLQVMKVNSR